MSAPEAIEVQRDEPYEAVWAEPVARVASHYGISGVALGKLCRRLAVPVPPRGYWARLKHGYKPPRPPLPAPPPRTPKTATLTPGPRPVKSVSELPPKISALVLHERQPEHRIRVPERGFSNPANRRLFRLGLQGLPVPEPVLGVGGSDRPQRPASRPPARRRGDSVTHASATQKHMGQRSAPLRPPEGLPRPR
jgi:hypothetical protein